MRLPSTKTLAKIGVYVGVAGISSVMYMRWKIEERIRNTDYFRAAFQTLRQHRGIFFLISMKKYLYQYILFLQELLVYLANP